MQFPRSRKAAAGVAAGVLVLGLGAGAAVAAVGDDGDDDAPVTGAEADAAREAALADAPGTVTDIERGDDGDDAAWEVEVTREDGTEADVHLDADLGVVRVTEDGADDGTDD